MTTSAIGTTSELVACVDLARKGFEVFRAIHPDASCDLIALAGPNAYRIEVRTGFKDKTGTIHYPTHHLKEGRHDHLAVVLEDDSVLYLPDLPIIY